MGENLQLGPSTALAQTDVCTNSVCTRASTWHLQLHYCCDCTTTRRDLCVQQVDCSSAVLQPGEGRDIAVTFRPTAAVAYREAVPLHINGLYTVNEVVAGDLLAPSISKGVL